MRNSLRARTSSVLSRALERNTMDLRGASSWLRAPLFR
jgi:hypothetical protein